MLRIQNHDAIDTHMLMPTQQTHIQNAGKLTTKDYKWQYDNMTI